MAYYKNNKPNEEAKNIVNMVLDLVYPKETELKGLYRELLLSSEWVNVKETFLEEVSRDKNFTKEDAIKIGLDPKQIPRFSQLKF